MLHGGEIYDNEATGGATLGGALFVQGEFNLSGTAKIKYGVEDPDTHAVSKGKGKNDICIFQNYNLIFSMTFKEFNFVFDSSFQ